jgi:uncharacterized protein YjiS (DUF1127 family)
MGITALQATGVAPRRLLNWFAEWRRRSRSRSELRRLNATDLSDIGVSRCTAEFEASKPFWMA